ncbi:MAG: universal stress protein [Gammaproteobacteria bacterium]|jgi:nucleotide-binding universal stress UspA family protein|nr:universal stress protein [Gammaproteobacteria bacterium]
MATKYIVACDGSSASGRAIKVAVEQAKLNGASLLLVHVLEWSPYSFLTPEELEERHKRRNEELKRAQLALVDPLVESLSSEGVESSAIIRYGHVSETIADIAEKEGAAQIFVGRTGQSTLTKLIFGSVAASLAQIAPVPCTIVP